MAEATPVHASRSGIRQRLDRARKDKKVSNEDWQSPGDPDARIARMKDGTTHPASKAERKQKTRRWTDKPEAYERAFRADRRRVRGEKGKRLNRWRSERCERPFAHVCETGGGRKSWLRGLLNVTKAHVLQCAAFNLGLLLRNAFRLGKPRSGAALFELVFRLWRALTALVTDLLRPIANSHLSTTIVPRSSFQPPFYRLSPQKKHSVL